MILKEIKNKQTKQNPKMKLLENLSIKSVHKFLKVLPIVFQVVLN